MIVTCLAGHGRVEQQRTTWEVHEGEVFLVPAGEPHRWIESDRLERWEISVCVPCLVASEGALLLEPFERVRAGAAPIVRIAPARLPFLDALHREMAGMEGDRDAASALARRSLLNLILHDVQRAMHPQADTTLAAGVVVDALRFIERNCLQRISLREVAEAVGRSPAYVTTALSRATGLSAVEWITAGRMAEARRILLHSDEMIDVVAERVGYADSTHFIRVFQRTQGATPAAWRASTRRSGRGASA
ncbi:DNA-binding response regulator, AraC family [Vulgatibacter incomptus]|uniref:DNA-binding response regulator, AraC family n=1 Tax=Vulgatibacter incomptus TaxID=1391653 RepID=A0A0K1PBN8_9BACT|nr:DNA-binding response regulator, AraC family [Vulgatibacter incomptus]